jgi:hypothetical protein
MFRTAFPALILSSALSLLAPSARADGPPPDEGRARTDRGERKSEAIKNERRTNDPDDGDSGLQKKSKAGEKRAEPAP